MYEQLLIPIVLVIFTLLITDELLIIERYGIAVGFAVIFLLLFKHNYQKLLNYLINKVSSDINDIKVTINTLNNNIAISNTRLEELCNKLDKLIELSKNKR